MGPFPRPTIKRHAAAIPEDNLCIAFILLLTLSIWKKAHHQDSAGTEQAVKALPFREIARIPGVKLMWCLFITSCAIECTCGGWGSTYLVEYKHMDAVTAARMVMLYYMGMALGRFLSGILAARLNSWQIIRIGQWILGIALIGLLLPLSSGIAAACRGVPKTIFTLFVVVIITA